MVTIYIMPGTVWKCLDKEVFDKWSLELNWYQERIRTGDLSKNV